MLQSQNLRAALLRVLTELKASGILPRETLLRKSTFDECKGDKFEELLYNFAQVTLQKVASRSPNTARRALETDAANVVPLIISYKVSLSRVFSERNATIDKFRQQEGDLTGRKAEIDKKRRWLLENQPPTIAPDEDVVQSLRALWPGDRAWINALLEESPPRSDFTRPRTDEQKATPITHLEQQVIQQQISLKRLKQFKASLPPVPASSQVSKVQDGQQSPRLLFDAHLHAQDTSKTSDVHAAHEANNSCADLLARMRQELYDDDRQAPASHFDGGLKHGSRKSSIQDFSHQPPSKDQTNASSECSWLDETPQPVASAVRATLSATDDTSDMVEYDDPSTAVRKSTDEGVGRPDSMSEAQANHPTSLTDRTRVSMAQVRDCEKSGRTPIPKEQETSTNPDSVPTSPSTPLMISSPAQTLVERTRNSLAFVNRSFVKPIAEKKSKMSRTSQLYPVNQFETPRKVSASFECNTNSRASTPRDMLFSDDAEVTSIFKSRPKIALSPMLSPDRSAFDLGVDDSMLGTDLNGAR